MKSNKYDKKEKPSRLKQLFPLHLVLSALAGFILVGNGIDSQGGTMLAAAQILAGAYALLANVILLIFISKNK